MPTSFKFTQGDLETERRSPPGGIGPNSPRVSSTSRPASPTNGFREIEFDENMVRLDLTEHEASKATLKQIKAAEAEIAEEVSAQIGPKGGRPKGGDREVARRT